MLRSLAASVMSAKKHHEIKLRAKPEKKQENNANTFEFEHGDCLKENHTDILKEFASLVFLLVTAW